MNLLGYYRLARICGILTHWVLIFTGPYELSKLKVDFFTLHCEFSKYISRNPAK